MEHKVLTKEECAKLAEEIGNLRYDSLVDLLNLLEAKLRSDSDKDDSRGRHCLAQALNRSASGIGIATVHIQKAWEISEPHMK